MKCFFQQNSAKGFLVFTLILITFFSCQQDQSATLELRSQIQNSPTDTYSSDVVVKWLNMQLDMLRVPLAPGTGSQDAGRALAYCGIAAYESVVKGMPAYQSLSNQLNGLPSMPEIDAGLSYYWPASANAALADMNRKLFPSTSTANKAKIDSLENALKATFILQSDAHTIDRSVAFGKEVATRIFTYASTDGSGNVNPLYIPKTGPGLWESTPPNFPTATNPYASQRRLLVPSGKQFGIGPPPAYSTKTSSTFYKMVKEVYDISQHLTPEQTAAAIYHRDAPGYPGGGHFVSILAQVITQAQSKLDIAALAYAKVGIASYDATTICFVKKYTYNLVRPITYIRNVMGYATWSAVFNTPGHPEFPSAHAVNSEAIAEALSSIYGYQFGFILHSYDYLGLPARSYWSFEDMAKEMSDSRVFAGIHYQASCDKGRWLGAKIGENILRKIAFEKSGPRYENLSASTQSKLQSTQFVLPTAQHTDKFENQ